MTYPLKKISFPIQLPARRDHAPLIGTWTRDAHTGRLIQTWRESAEAERSGDGRAAGLGLTLVTGGRPRS